VGWVLGEWFDTVFRGLQTGSPRTGPARAEWKTAWEGWVLHP